MRRGAWLGTTPRAPTLTLTLTTCACLQRVPGELIKAEPSSNPTPDPIPNPNQVRLREAWGRCVDALGQRSEGLELRLPAGRTL